MTKRRGREFWYGIKFMNNCFYAFDTPGMTLREMQSELSRLKREMPSMYCNPTSKIIKVREVKPKQRRKK